MATIEKISEVLNCILTQEEYNKVCEGWTAFAQNPEEYRNSVVVDMVRLFLNK